MISINWGDNEIPLGENFRETGRTAEKLHFDYKDLMRGVRVEDIEEENKKGEDDI